MGFAELMASLNEEAESEAARLRDEGRRRAEELLETHRAEQAEQRRRVLESRETELRETHRARMLAEEHELMGEVLGAREELMVRVLDVVEDELGGIVDDPRYGEALRRELREARSYAENRPVTIFCEERSLPLIRDACPDLADSTLEVAQGLGPGFLLETEDAALRVDATLRSRLGARRAAVARRALDELGVLDTDPQPGPEGESR